MRKARPQSIILALLLCTSSGCGTMFNLTGHEPWLMGPAPTRPIVPFGGVDNDLRWMKRGISEDGWEPGPIVAAAIDVPFSFVGDLVTLPWTAYQALRPPKTGMKLYFDDQEMREELLKYLAIGTPMETAKRIMEESTFKCEEYLFARPSYLHCSAIYRTRSLFFTDEIQVLLYHEAGRLSNIEVHCRSFGP